MKRKIIECDICNKEITEAKERYEFKRYRKYVFFSKPPEIELRKLDMCEACFSKLQDLCSRENMNEKELNK